LGSGDIGLQLAIGDPPDEFVTLHGFLLQVRSTRFASSTLNPATAWT